MTFRKALLAATMLALPVAAQAQPVSGFYVGAGAGLNMLAQTDVQPSGSENYGPSNSMYEFDNGWVGVVSLGYGFGNGVRAEIEGSFRENNVRSASGFGEPGSAIGASGRAQSYGVMANALYDFDLGSSFPLMPYVGIGAGYIWHKYDTRNLSLIHI